MNDEEYLKFRIRNGETVPLDRALFITGCNNRQALKGLMDRRGMKQAESNHYCLADMLEIANRHEQPLPKRRKGTRT